MSEKLHEQGGEQFTAPKTPEAAEHHAKTVEHEGHKQPENRVENLEKVKKAIEDSRPKESEELKKQMAQPKEKTHYAPPNKELKKHARRTYLGKARRQLDPTARAFSKWIHNDAVDAISEMSAKTIFRPSGLLIGGAFTFIASFYYYHLSQNNGFRYNFTAVLLTFIIGFIIGLFVEAIYRVLSKKHKA